MNQFIYKFLLDNCNAKTISLYEDKNQIVMDINGAEFTIMIQSERIDIRSYQWTRNDEHQFFSYVLVQQIKALKYAYRKLNKGE